MKIILSEERKLQVNYAGEDVQVSTYFDKKGYLRTFEAKLGNGTELFFKAIDHRSVVEHDKLSKTKIRKWVYCGRKAIEASVLGFEAFLRAAGTRLNDIFHGKVNITLWETFLLAECPTFDLKPVFDEWHNGPKLVGVTTYHKMIWEEFVRRAEKMESNASRSLEDPYMIVFEQDAVCGIPNCGDLALQQVQETTADILYLGWCTQKNEWSCPHCAHAYALSIKGAKALLQRVYNCGGFVDMQMKVAADGGYLEWTLAKIPSNITQKTFTKGLFVQNW